MKWLRVALLLASYAVALSAFALVEDYYGGTFVTPYCVTSHTDREWLCFLVLATAIVLLLTR
jgi:hypothetical protein